ncbi:MAG: amidohydrolase family protein [Phycisphaerales bacterium]|nr:amidohydrolase family protein [Phycisphaerales bacterium]
MALGGGVARGQDLGLKSEPQKRAVAIVGATVHPVAGPAIENGVVVFSGGKLIRIAASGAPVDDVEVIRAEGKHIYPGLIGAMTQLGLSEIGSVRSMRDTAETGGVTPEVRPVTAVNPDSTLIPVARSAGVLTAGVAPGGGLVPGKVSVIRLDGWTTEDMTVEADAGLVVGWPAMRTFTGSWMSRSEDEQWRDIRRQLAALDEVFDSAGAYARARAADGAAAVDIRWEAMRGVFAGQAAVAQKPVFIQAQDYDQIRAAVVWAKQRGLRAVIVGGREAPLCADLLKAEGVPVIVQGTHSMPRRADSDYDEPFRLPAKLETAGVRWCLASGQDTAHERNLPNQAATAVAYGLGREEALRAITLSAAEVLGIADRLGSLEEGKSATLIVTDGDVLEVTTRVEVAWIDGRRQDLSNKQTKLAEKYREKYRRSGDLKEEVKK